MTISWRRTGATAAGGGLVLGASILTAGIAAGRALPERGAHGQPVASLASCAPRWHIVPDPSPGTSFFAGVSAASPRVAWAVGSAGEGTSGQPLVARWDSARWRVTDGPVLPPAPASAFFGYGSGAAFSAVAALSADDAWAVGSRPTTTGTRPFIARWVGGRWRLAVSPDTSRDSTLRAVAAVSPRDVWAVGDAHGTRTLVEHWDGRIWRLVPTPRLSGQDVRLTGVAALSAASAWVVGTTGSAVDSSRRGLVERWDGLRWRVLPLPQPSVVDDALAGISASSATDIWVVGSAEGNDYASVPLVERWTGTTWRVVARPALPPAVSGLAAVAARSSRDVWAVGDAALVHWDGARWSTTTLRTSAYTGGADYSSASTPDVTALTVIPGGGLWAVGRVVENTDQQDTALIARYDDVPCR